jgi:hypothetical protein
LNEERRHEPIVSEDASDWSLARLIAPAEVATFVTTLSRCEAVALRGEPTRFAGLFDEARFRAAILRAQCAARSSTFQLAALECDPLGDGLTFSTMIGADEVDAALERGQTVCATDVSAGDEALSALARRLNRELGCAGSVRFNGYWSPAGALTRLHTDVRISTTLQLSGHKTWRYQRRPAFRWPTSNAQIDRFGDAVALIPSRVQPPPPPACRDLEEITLGPGDLLSVPAGAWHSVRAEERALALNLSIRPLPLPAVIALLIDRALGSSESWRAGLPLAAGEPGAIVPPSPVRDCLRTGLGELRAFLDHFDVAGADASELWQLLNSGALRP